MSGIHLRVGRCDSNSCSMDADTSLYGYFTQVTNCHCDENGFKFRCDSSDPTCIPQGNTVDSYKCRCDVIINNRNNRYVCKQTTSISDCVDYLTYCKNPTFSNKVGNDQFLTNYCTTMDNHKLPDEGFGPETFNNYGSDQYYILDGNIIWNLQLQASKCGTSRSAIKDSQGFPFPSDQSPECYPYSTNFMENSGNIDTLKCNDNQTPLFESVCSVDDPNCDVPGSDYSKCCMRPVNCESTAQGCQYYRDLGVKICGDQDAPLNPCENPCATLIDIPQEAETCGIGDCPWKEDIQSFFCPPIGTQEFWFGDNSNPALDPSEYYDSENYPETGYNQRICSEEYYNLCTLSLNSPDPECKLEWKRNSGDYPECSGSGGLLTPDCFNKDYPTQYPVVYQGF